MIDPSTLGDETLLRFARTRIIADCARIARELDNDPNVGDDVTCDIGVSAAAGAVVFRDDANGIAYFLSAPAVVTHRIVGARQAA
jgi:hypothetical protein